MSIDKQLYDNFINILKIELIPALGCTEPIAIAFASAKAREVLGEMPEKITMNCSGNIIKNVKSVTVPNSNGMKGINAAAILGVVGGKADKKLEVLSDITDEDRKKALELIDKKICNTVLVENVPNLYINATVEAKGHSVSVVIEKYHTNITKIIKDGQVIFDHNNNVNTDTDEVHIDKKSITIRSILDFANEVKIEDVKDLLDRQIEYNTNISNEGLKNDWGAKIGKTIIKTFGDNINSRLMAKAAAGSDARMSGCPMPVVTNSGSGNQGMTVSLPVIEYAKEINATDDKLYRALIVSNLISVHLKYYIGQLSAFCGAVTAGCGAMSGIAYLKTKGDYKIICDTITNILMNVGGIVCDGAKASCAAKIFASLNAGILGLNMAMDGIVFNPGDGLVLNDIESTIKNIGYLGRVGMKQTDVEILKAMIGQANIEL